jgi:hypothetical protein
MTNIFWKQVSSGTLFSADGRFAAWRYWCFPAIEDLTALAAVPTLTNDLTALQLY